MANITPIQRPTTEFEAAAQEEFRKDAAQQKGPTFDQLATLGVSMLQELAQAERDRQEKEQIWLDDLRQYKGKYDTETLAKIGNRSKAFVRKTRVKVKTVDARMLDLLFPANAEQNWKIDATPKPSVSPEFRKRVVDQLRVALNQAQVEIAKQQGVDPTTVQAVEPNKKQIDEAVRKEVRNSSKRMAQTIADQLSEVKYKAAAKEVIHSGNLFGTGILKGPLADRKTRTRFAERGGKWSAIEESYTVPFVGWVSLWDFYPDMAATKIEDCRYIIQRHRLTMSAMVKLANLPKFAKAAILEYIKARPNGEVQAKHFDEELRALGDRQTLNLAISGLYEIYERWGWLTAEQLQEAGVSVPRGRMNEMFFGVVWFLPNGQVVKAAIQPINGVAYPFHAYYYDKDDTSIFGEGVASIMRDDQDMINAGTRMMLDNAAACAGPQLEIDTTVISTAERYDEFHPFKVWKRNGGDPGRKGVTIIEAPSHVAEIGGIIDRFDINADETTAIPRYMTGENMTAGAGGTMGGLSMLMGAANIVLKDLVVNYDEGITKPFIGGVYRWNMRFNPDPSIKGDYDVTPQGASSLVAKEVRAQALGAYAQTMQPEERPHVKWDKFAKMRADSMDLSDIIKTEEEVEAEMSDPAVQKQNQLNQRAQEAQVAQAEAKAALDQATAAMRSVEAMAKRITSVYEAMQAAGVAVGAPHVAPAGDEILRSAGWQDATPQTPIAGIEPNQPITPPDMAATAGVGKQAGINTPELM